MAITTKHFFARNGMFSQSGSHMLLHIIVCKIDASGQFAGFNHLLAHLHPEMGHYSAL